MKVRKTHNHCGTPNRDNRNRTAQGPVISQQDPAPFSSAPRLNAPSAPYPVRGRTLVVVLLLAGASCGIRANHKGSPLQVRGGGHTSV